MIQFHQPLLVRLINTPRNKYVVYMFLHVPRHWLSILYQIFMMMLITVCILVTMFMQIDVGSQTSYIVLFWLDLSCLIIFFSEFVLNVWSSTVLPQYSGKYGIFWMLINPLYIIDMAVIGVTIADVALDCVWLPLAAGLRGFRMIWFLQNRFVMIRLLWKAIWSERFQLMVSIYYCAVWVFSFGFLMYFIEQPFNSYFNTVANSVWWAVVTFTTVGYGNAAPITTAGKIVTAFAMILGVWLFALPAGIVGAALALKCEEECSTAGTLRQNFGAAMVQNAWKVYRIRKQQDRQQEGDPPLLVRISPHDHSLQFINRIPDENDPLNVEYFNPNAVKFIFLLKHAYYKRKFIASEEINDSKNFYATYMQTSWQQTNMLLNLHTKIDHLWDSMVDARRQIETIQSNQTLPVQTRQRPSIDDQRGNGDNGPSGGQPPSGDQAENDILSQRSGQTSVKSNLSNKSSSKDDKSLRHNPFLLLKRRHIPLKRILRQNVQCWNCLHRKKRSKKIEEPSAEPLLPSQQLLLDLSTPRSSQHDLLL